MASARQQYALVALNLLALLLGGLAVPLAIVQGETASQPAQQGQLAPGSDQLFAGVSEVAQPAYFVDVLTGSATPTFLGHDIRGAAYDLDGDRLFFVDFGDLWQWSLSHGAPSRIGKITSASNGINLGIYGLAYYDGVLYGTSASGSAANPEGLYLIDLDTAVATLFVPYADGGTASAFMAWTSIRPVDSSTAPTALPMS